MGQKTCKAAAETLPSSLPLPLPKELVESSVGITIGSSERHAAPRQDLMLTAEGAAEMYITNDGTCKTGGVWQPYAVSEKDWALATLNALNTVSVKFRDRAGNESMCASDTIVHDDISPAGGIEINGGSTTHTNQLTVRLEFDVTGEPHEMYVTRSSSCEPSANDWISYAEAMSWQLEDVDGSQTVSVKFRDLAGNSDEGCHDSAAITLDREAPDASGGDALAFDTALTDIGGTLYTTSLNQTIQISVAEATDMYISPNAGCSGDDQSDNYESYAASKAVTLNADSSTTLYGRFKDEAGNLSVNCAVATVVHDGTAPDAVTGLTHATTANGRDLSVSWNASSDNGSGLEGYELAVGTTAGGNEAVDWIAVGDTTSHDFDTLVLTNGDYYVSIRALDKLGNRSTVTTGSAVKMTNQLLGVASGPSDHTCVSFTNGRIQCFGRNDYSQLGLGDAATDLNASTMGDDLQSIDLGTGRTARSVHIGKTFGCAVLDTYAVKCWGTPDHTGLGETTTLGDDPNELGDSIATVNLGHPVVSENGLLVGSNHACAILNDGSALPKLKCWGNNLDGQLGIGSTTDTALPTAVSLPTGRYPVQGSAGDRHTCLLLDNNDVVCFGSNWAGHLGLGTR